MRRLEETNELEETTSEIPKIHGFMNLRIREFYRGHKSGLSETQKINILLVNVPKTHAKIMESINFGDRESRRPRVTGSSENSENSGARVDNRWRAERKVYTFYNYDESQTL